MQDNCSPTAPKSSFPIESAVPASGRGLVWLAPSGLRCDLTHRLLSSQRRRSDLGFTCRIVPGPLEPISDEGGRAVDVRWRHAVQGVDRTIRQTALRQFGAHRNFAEDHAISIKRAAPAVQQLRSLSSQHLARSCRISADPVLSSERTARKALNVASGSVGNLVFGAIIAAMEGEYGNHEGRAELDCWVAGIRSPSLAGGLLWAPGPGWEYHPDIDSAFVPMSTIDLDARHFAL